MTDTSIFWQRFEKMPVIGIARNIPTEALLSILPHYVAAGLQSVEITMNSPGAEKAIQEAVKQFGAVLNIGAGTVCSVEDFDKALNAGATFIVTPIVDEAIINASRQSALPIFTGALTPTEIYKAWRAGSDMVKLFPASSVTTGFIKDILGPFPDIKLVPTGGIDLENGVSFLNAGAAGIAMGSQLFGKTFVREKNWEALGRHFKLIADRIALCQKRDG